MALRSARRIHRVMHPVIATVVAISLLSTPVTYRGGAEAAHAHTIFQLWEDVRIGSFTHHAPEAEPRVEPIGDQAMGDHPAESGRRSDAVDLEPDHGATIGRDGAGAREPMKGFPTAPGASERDGGVAPAGTGAIERGESAPAAIELDEDAPVVSSAFTPSVRGTVLALPADPTWPQAESFVSASRQVTRMSGITDSPIAPPPRRAA